MMAANEIGARARLERRPFQAADDATNGDATNGDATSSGDDADYCS